MPTAMLDPLLLGAMHTDIHTIIKAAVVGLAAEGVILGCVLVQTSNYFRLFPTDPRAYKVLVSLGTIMCTAQFILSTAASVKLVENSSDFTGYWMTDLKLNMVITLFLCFFRATAAVYFSRRMWGLTGKRIYVLVGLVTLVLLCTAFGITTTVYGFHPPVFTSITHGPRLLLWFDKIGMFAKAWAITCPILDVVICLTTVALLLRSKSTLGGSEKTLMKKVVILTTETMLPPAIMSIGILLFFEINGIFGSYDRSLVWVIGPTYYLTILHSLVARQKLAAIIYPISMDNILPGRNGIHPHDMSRSGSTRRLNKPDHLSTSGQVEMSQMDLSYDNRMSDHTFGKAQSETKQYQQDRRANWYESGQTPIKAMSNYFDEWQGTPASEQSWKENTIQGSVEDSPPFARVQQRSYKFV